MMRDLFGLQRWARRLGLLAPQPPAPALLEHMAAPRVLTPAEFRARWPERRRYRATGPVRAAGAKLARKAREGKL